MNFERAEKYRTKDPLGRFHREGDPFGAFLIKRLGEKDLFVIADGESDWEHVSVSTKSRCPTWQEMCFIKSLFWSDEDCVLQYHPPKSEYVNVHSYCLHLWRPKRASIPTPPIWMV